jgi:hypothetical protein
MEECKSILKPNKMETNNPKEMFHEDTRAAENAAKHNQSTIMDKHHNPFAAIASLYTNFFTNMAKLYPQPFHVLGHGIQNHYPLAAFNNKVNNNLNASELSKKYKEAIDTHLEASKTLFKSSVETNKKMMEDAHTHFSSTVNQTQEFLSQVLKTYEKPLTEEDAYAHESGLNDKTKHTTAPVNEVKDQKIK